MEMEEADVGLDFNSGTLGDSFMKIQTVLDTFSAPHSVLNDVPPGKKDGMFFIISNDPNNKKKMTDDCGEWMRPSCPKALFVKKGDSVISLFMKNNLYCVEKHAHKKRVYMPLEPQPKESEVLEVMRRYECMKIPNSNDIFKRRITWFIRIPPVFNFLTSHEALVEYTGVYPETPVPKQHSKYELSFILFLKSIKVDHNLLKGCFVHLLYLQCLTVSKMRNCK